jgi:DNA-binding beta-propeller fold protein YncE
MADAAAPAATAAAPRPARRVPLDARSGVIAFQSNRTGHFELFAANPNGSGVRQLTHTGPAVKNLIPSYSADGKRIVFGSDRGGLFGLYVARADGSQARRLTAPVLSTTGMFVDYNSPHFFPNGKEVLFISDRTGHNEIYVIDVNGTHQRQLTHTSSTVSNFIAAISPDGETIVFASDRTGHFELFTMTAAGGSVRQLTHTAAGTSNLAPAFSPDGKRIVFASTRTGHYEIFTMSNGGTGIRQVTHTASTAANLDPSFSPDGRKIVFYGSGSGHFEIYSVDSSGSHLRQITHTATTVTNQDPSWRPAPPARTVRRSVGLPRAATDGCSTAVAPARTLAMRTAFVSLAAPPFGIAVTSDGRRSLVDEVGGHVTVLSNAGFRPRVVRTIGVPNDALGNSLTPDGRYLLVADGGDGATVLSVRAAETGARHAVLGTLSQPGDTGPAGGAIEVASSPDGRYAFVAVEYQARIAVYDLRVALAKHFRGSSYVGSIPLGQLVDGLAVSRDGRWLYATSELAAGQGPVGSLSVIRLATAERRPARSVLSTVLAGCSPVRVALSPDGRTAWVAARGSDQLLAFSTTKLRTDPAHSQVAAIPVGEAPVGLALVNGGREIVVADSNRFDTPGARAELTIVRTGAALGQRPAVLGTISTGAFPREMALEPGSRTLLVGNYDSNQLQAVDLRHLP